MKTREEIQQEYERDSRAIWEDYWAKMRVLITNRNDNLHTAEVRRDAALAELDDPMLRLLAAGTGWLEQHYDCSYEPCTALRDAIDYAEQRRALETRVAE